MAHLFCGSGKTFRSGTLGRRIRLFNLASIKQWLHSGSRGLLAPGGDTCAACGAMLSAAGGTAPGRLPVCRRCCGAIPWIAPQHIQCAACGRYEACPDCPRRTDPHFVCNRSAVRYDETMKAWLGRLKYRGDERLQLLFAEMMGGVLERLLGEFKLRKKDVAFLTYVPLSPARQAERGFNQTELIARRLGDMFRIPVRSTLIRTRHTDKQSFKSRAERLNDLRGVFTIDPSFSADSLNRNHSTSPIILVDDVYTTGSTLDECARAIRQAAASDIYGLTWAR